MKYVWAPACGFSRDWAYDIDTPKRLVLLFALENVIRYCNHILKTKKQLDFLLVCSTDTSALIENFYKNSCLNASAH